MHPAPNPRDPKTEPATFRVILFAGAAASPRQTLRLIERIEREVPSARVSAVLWAGEHSAAPPFLGGLESIPASAGSPAPSPLRKMLAPAGHALLRFVHAAPSRPNPPVAHTLGDLVRACESQGRLFQPAARLNLAPLAEFVRRVDPDFGLVIGQGSFPEELFSQPRAGSVCVIADLLTEEQSPRVRIEARMMTHQHGEASATETFFVEPFDTPRSLDLKARLVANDLAVRVMGSHVPGGQPASVPPLGLRLESKRTPRELFQPYVPTRMYPTWKLLARSVLFLLYLIVRNWTRRLRGSFPVVILYHHIVTDRPYPDGIPTDFFLRHVEFLKKHYRIVSLREAIEMLRAGRVTAPTAVLTLDDGYVENYLNLRAVTEEAAVPAVLFVCTQKVAQQQMFQHDLDRGLQDFYPLTWEQVRYLVRNGFEIGSHTRTHFDCGSADAAMLHNEIAGAKSDLEEALGTAMPFFSFPWGHPRNMSPLAVEIAKQTYPHILSACGGANLPSEAGDCRHLLRSAHPNDLWELELALQSILALNLTTRS